MTSSVGSTLLFGFVDAGHALVAGYGNETPPAHIDFPARLCRKFCECDFSRPTQIDPGSGAEVCYLASASTRDGRGKEETRCIFAQGEVRQDAVVAAYCWQISGRDIRYQQRLMELDVEKRCNAPAVSAASRGAQDACPLADRDVHPLILSRADSEQQGEHSEARSAWIWQELAKTLKERGYNRTSMFLLAQNHMDQASLVEIKNDATAPIAHHDSDLADLVRLFGLGEAIPETRLVALFPSAHMREFFANRSIPHKPLQPSHQISYSFAIS